MWCLKSITFALFNNADVWIAVSARLSSTHNIGSKMISIRASTIIGGAQRLFPTAKVLNKG